MQKINLYNGQLIPKPEELPIQTLWLAAGVGVLLSFVLWYLAWSDVRKISQQHQTVFAQQQKLKNQITQLQSIIPSVEEKISAENKIKKLQKQLQFQEQTSQLITRLNSKQTAGYFGVLSNLSDLKKEKYWFTRILLNSDQLSLEGKTYESSAVANMVSQLQQLPNTNKVNFSKVIIEREKSKDRAANFYLYAKNEEMSVEP
jgi:Tfp pilus assembly protein PilN